MDNNFYSPFPNDLDISPLPRARSNTWPCRPPPPPVNQDEQQQQEETSQQQTFETSTNLQLHQIVEEPHVLNHVNHHGDHLHDNNVDLLAPQNLFLQKKSTSRRNAWGNLSYADLITQAISSSPEKRLTLSQIYDWMVGNVPYFKDKGDSNSSAGWKNSIRHNLSLHSRFIRVQNEGTGKSSWWMLNPDAKPGKGQSSRRRAASMETSKFEKKRGRVKRKIEQMRADQGQGGGGQGVTASMDDLFGKHCGGQQSTSGSDEQLLPLTTPPSTSSTSPYPAPPPPSTTDLFIQRPRASSNASSIGRLSPLLLGNQGGVEFLEEPYGGYAGGWGGSLEGSQLSGMMMEMVKIEDEVEKDDGAGGGVDLFETLTTSQQPPLSSTSSSSNNNNQTPSSLSTNHTHQLQQLKLDDKLVDFSDFSDLQLLGGQDVFTTEFLGQPTQQQQQQWLHSNNLGGVPELDASLLNFYGNQYLVHQQQQPPMIVTTTSSGGGAGGGVGGGGAAAGGAGGIAGGSNHWVH